MSLMSLMKKTVHVQRALPEALTFSSGGTKHWVTIHADVKCEIQPRSGDVDATIGTQQALMTHRMYAIPKDVAGIREGDRIVEGTDYYAVIGVRDIDEWKRLATIDLAEVVGRTID